jgi:hypothetical protein
MKSTEGVWTTKSTKGDARIGQLTGVGGSDRVAERQNLTSKPREPVAAGCATALLASLSECPAVCIRLWT